MAASHQRGRSDVWSCQWWNTALTRRLAPCRSRCSSRRSMVSSPFLPLPFSLFPAFTQHMCVEQFLGARHYLRWKLRQ